jgi:hypothetical protein
MAFMIQEFPHQFLVCRVVDRMKRTGTKEYMGDVIQGVVVEKHLESL